MSPDETEKGSLLDLHQKTQRETKEAEEEIKTDISKSLNKEKPFFTPEEEELFGKAPESLSVPEQREQKALILAKKEDEAEKVAAAERDKLIKEDEKNRSDNKVEWLTQYHLCTYCGGQKTKVMKDAKKQERVVVGMEIPQPSADGKKPPVLVCYKCLSKLFHNMLGVARHHGTEMLNLMGVSQ